MHIIKDENGNIVQHGHEDHDEHCGHLHDAECPHGNEPGNCETCDHEQNPRKEAEALLTYMVQHNESHAAELDQMADTLINLGMEDAAKTIREGVEDFQKANLRFSLALTQVKEHMKEA